jgi:4-hydroxy-2-oxoheptanedioate aldolase
VTTVPDSITARSSERLRARWRAQQPAFGVWSTLADATVAELLAAAPFDYVCVDLQHGLATAADLPAMLQAMRAAGRAPLVRPLWKDPVDVMRALDTGAAGVIVPMVDSAADAAKVVSACRFPPAGARSWGPMWGDVRADGALPPAEQDAAVLCLVMVETQAGVDAVEEIAAVPGVDGIYIGPNDLALGTGYGRGTYRDTPEIDQLIQRILDACRAAGIAAGLHCSDVEMARHWAGRGATMLTAATDSALLKAAADAAMTAVRQEN